MQQRNIPVGMSSTNIQQIFGTRKYMFQGRKDRQVRKLLSRMQEGYSGSCHGADELWDWFREDFFCFPVLLAFLPYGHEQKIIVGLLLFDIARATAHHGPVKIQFSRAFQPSERLHLASLRYRVWA